MLIESRAGVSHFAFWEEEAMTLRMQLGVGLTLLASCSVILYHWTARFQSTNMCKSMLPGTRSRLKRVSAVKGVADGAGFSPDMNTDEHLCKVEAVYKVLAERIAKLVKR